MSTRLPRTRGTTNNRRPIPRFWSVLSLVLISLGFVAGTAALLLFPLLPSQRLYELQLGDIVPEDIRAPAQISYTSMQRVLQTLLNERISIRDLPTILEGIAEATGYTANIQMITEHVRSRIGRQICAQHTTPAGYLPLITLSPQWEHAFIEAVVGDGDNRELAMAPSKLQEFIRATQQAIEQASAAGEPAVLITSPGIDQYLAQGTRAGISAISDRAGNSRSRSNAAEKQQKG